MSLGKFTSNNNKWHKLQNPFTPTHRATRRHFTQATDDSANKNITTGERISYDDSLDHIDYHHDIEVSEGKAFRDDIGGRFAQGQTGGLRIFVRGNVKTLSKKDEWLIKQDSLADDQWYQVLEITPIQRGSAILMYELELEPKEGNRKGDEDF